MRNGTDFQHVTNDNLDLVLLFTDHTFLEHKGVAELLNCFHVLLMLLFQTVELFPDAFEALCA